ncbi:DUF732 domain-containing protein [Mycobacterium asiaticum]|uniref:DUF732 domain-containing protein n=1 Tax=Mycobacterium asiaticum TaxID=1790 RepID=A0A1A3N969_MYCAS|nr:DUF732 domain-containing protein [Mycobacterium asiaticum]OBK18326.1 hypothetical protein A5636_21190 [Mycobacterium asiaticum]
MKPWRHQPLTVRLLAGTAGLLTAAAALAAPAEASPVDDAFITALSNAGVNYGDPLNAEALGHSVCPMLAQPGGNFAAAASRVGGNGMSPEMASMFTTIAIQMYCPSVMADVASGKIPGGLQQIPGMAGIPGMEGIPGMAGIPGLPAGF